jgi:hypothetical protein
MLGALVAAPRGYGTAADFASKNRVWPSVDESEHRIAGKRAHTECREMNLLGVSW